MNLTALRQKILSLLTSNHDWRYIVKEVNRAFSDYAAPTDFKEKLLFSIKNQYDWIKDKVMSDEELSVITKELNRHYGQFATARGRIQEDVKYIVSRGLRKGEDTKIMRNKLIDRLGVLNYHADTIVRTAKAGFSGIDTIHQATEARVEYLTFSGPPAERDFCRNHLHETYSIEEIRKMNNGTPLSVLYYCGGYNCRHSWSKATQDEIEAYNK